MIADILPVWLGHPLTGRGYQFYSGIGAATIEALTVLVAVAVTLWRVRKHLECHVDGCRHWGHPVQGTSYRACRPHHPHHQEPVTAEHIAHVAKHGHNPAPLPKPRKPAAKK